MEKEVPISHTEEVFEPKISKNGSRYDRRVYIEVAKTIFELYTRVIGQRKVTNGQINKSFA
jgi:hypothetical protein